MRLESSTNPELPARVMIWAGQAQRGALEVALRDSSLLATDFEHESPEVIVVAPGAPELPSHATGNEAGVERGVVAIVPATVAADVTLPADSSPRELVMACTLLAQIVRLRRMLREGVQESRVWQQEAGRDPLTQLPNRRGWNQELARRIQAARHAREPLCLALVDLDHFKQVNDGWGHAAGDQLLLATGAALRSSLRQDDFVARLGGDEFGLLLSGLDADAATAVIERVRSGLPARIAQATPHVTSASVGYTVFDGQAETTAEQLESLADRARRLAKSQGRNRAILAPGRG